MYWHCFYHDSIVTYYQIAGLYFRQLLIVSIAISYYSPKVYTYFDVFVLFCSLCQ